MSMCNYNVLTHYLSVIAAYENDISIVVAQI
jgi:hypothetical protein